MERLRNIWDAFVRHCSDALHSFLRHALEYVITTGDALSQLVNVVVFFSDNANESVSGRAWRLRNKHFFWGIMHKVIDWCALPFESDHCQLSHKADVSRAARLMRDQGL